MLPKVKCFMCNEEFDDFKGMYISFLDLENEKVNNMNLCKECYNRVYKFILENKNAI